MEAGERRKRTMEILDTVGRDGIPYGLSSRADGAESPASILDWVGLPDPEGPSSATISPSTIGVGRRDDLDVVL